MYCFPSLVLKIKNKDLRMQEKTNKFNTEIHHEIYRNLPDKSISENENQYQRHISNFFFTANPNR